MWKICENNRAEEQQAEIVNHIKLETNAPKLEPLFSAVLQK